MLISRFLSAGLAELPAKAQRKRILQAGFAMLLALLAFCAYSAYRIQKGFSDRSATIYHAHLSQDETLMQLRRILWQASILVRDYLIDRSPDRNERFRSALSAFRRESRECVESLTLNPVEGQDSARVRRKLDEFWRAMEAVPERTANLDPSQLYPFLQNEIAPRRAAMTQLLLELSALGREDLEGTELQLARTRQDAASRLAKLIGAALLVGLVFSALSIRHLGRLEAKTASQYEELARTTAELHALSSQLMVIQEAERSRLSRELHDEIGQALATLRLELARLESTTRASLPDIHGRLARARGIVDSTVKSIRHIALMLRPSLLDDLGLAPALQWLAEDFERRTGTLCRVEDLNVTEDLPVDVRTCVFRVAQEALHNVEKHAAASKVLISLRQSEDALRVRIQDDGRGMPVEVPPGRHARNAQLGILGMRERVAGLGGKFEIAAAPGGTGTFVEAAIPLPPPPGASSDVTTSAPSRIAV